MRPNPQATADLVTFTEKRILQSLGKFVKNEHDNSFDKYEIVPVSVMY